MPYCRINGMDITRYILLGGFQASENDVDGPDSGRTMDAVMQRDKVAQKNRADIKLVPIKKDVLDEIIPLLRSTYFMCDTDLFAGGPMVMEMYNSTRKYGANLIDTQGETWYLDTSFNIIER